jgi:hypothetical protein
MALGILGVVIVTSIILKLNWWNKLDEASAESVPVAEKALVEA